MFGNGFAVANNNGLWASLPSSSENIKIGGGHRFGDFVVFKTALGDTDREFIEGYLAHKFGLSGSLNPSNPYAGNMDYIVNTGNVLDVGIGTNDEGNHFDGLADEVRIYDRGLSLQSRSKVLPWMAPLNSELQLYRVLQPLKFLKSFRRKMRPSP